MKPNPRLLPVAVIACSFALTGWALNDPSPTPLGAEKSSVNFLHIEIKNHQDETLGRITDLGLDLVNGRIVEVLVKTDSSLDVDNKIVAVPPGALMRDPDNQIYRINASRELFRTAAAIDLAQWEDFGRSDRVAAAYHLFGQEPYFLQDGLTVSGPETRAKVSLGYVERAHKISGLPVGNYQGEQFGKVSSLTLDILKGRILSVIVVAPGNLRTASVIPARALEFNAARDALLLDDTVEEYANEPRYVYTAAAYGNAASSQEEAFRGPDPTAALEQGESHQDIDRTLLIYQNIRLAKIYHRYVQVGTLDGRVTLRGWVRTADDQRRIGEIAIAASRLELVANQLTVGRPVRQP
jgi:sporulation protein YlmC with PRC-barrel domain